MMTWEEFSEKIADLGWPEVPSGLGGESRSCFIDGWWSCWLRVSEAAEMKTESSAPSES